MAVRKEYTVAQPKRIDTLEVSQNLPYQKKFWKIERFGWLVFVVLLVLVGLGFAGGMGPLNQAVAANDQIEVQYQPFARRVAPTNIEITLKQLSGSTAQLVVQRDLLNEYNMQNIVPQPSEVQAGAETLTYKFSLPEGAKEMTVVFSVEPANTSVGTINGQIGRTAQDLLTINQWVYP